MQLRQSALLFIFLLTACQPVLAPVASLPPTPTPRPSPNASPLPRQTSVATIPITPAPLTPVPLTPAPLAPSSTPLPVSISLDPADWKDWPVLPVITERARQIYQLGQSLGNDAHAFSIFGDCQSERDVFMGIYETDPLLASKLPANLRATVAWFTGSFNRESPTVKGGTTPGGLMWPPWHENKYTCTIYETPIQCELRLHKPAFVIIHVGTHYESRNQDYMRKVLDQLIAAGVVPILASKADNDDLDDHINAGYAQLAAEYNLPFWNFWRAVSELPNRGLYTRPDAIYQGDIYLTDVAVDIQRMSALLVLDSLRRAVIGP